jgi:hypothetical protein
MHDAAAELAKRGRHVKVVTSARGYDDPSKRYPPREVRDGVAIRRVPLSSFGKKSLILRALAMGLFMLQCVLHALFTPRLECVVVSTSPPMCSFAAVFAGLLRSFKIKFWVMDLNPDQAVEMGLLKERSLIARLFNWFNRLILRRADDVVALDRFMADRLNKKVMVGSKMHVMPPWPHDEHLDVVEHERNPFRKQHNLAGKFVFMYSGNHGLTTPVTTVLQAALKLQHRTEIVFMFIGGGHGKKEVEKTIAEHKPANIISLPYQPIDQLKYSLSAADVHLVTMGNEVVGVIHPCKIYGAMRIARPILLVGPSPCHATDLIDEGRCGWRIAHGDVEGAVRVVEAIAATPAGEREAMGKRAAALVEEKYSMNILRGSFCDVVERGLSHVRPAPAPSPSAV